MSSGFDHALRALSDEERAVEAARNARMREDAIRLGSAWLARIGLCCTRGCRGPATHEGTYRYVTGRAGRVSVARRLLCDTHAASFRAKYLEDGSGGTDAASGGNT